MAMPNGNVPMCLPMLDGKSIDNYDRWCVRMNAIFGFQEVLDVVTNGLKVDGGPESEAQKATNREAKKKDCKALCLIHQCVDSVNFDKIAAAKNSKEAWDILAKSFAGVEKLKKMRLQTLRCQYELLQMEDTESVGEYLGRMQPLVNAMKNCGETLEDQSINEKVLRTLTTEFDHIVVALEETRDLSTLKLEELQGSLEAHE